MNLEKLADETLEKLANETSERIFCLIEANARVLTKAELAREILGALRDAREGTEAKRQIYPRKVVIKVTGDTERRMIVSEDDERDW